METKSELLPLLETLCSGRPDISLAREKLKWEPKTPLHPGLEITMDYFRREIGLILT
jgi:nucleoside-diphosphate-sugar epimerase